MRPAIWSLFLPHYLFITGDEIPEAYEKLNAYYTKHEKHMKKGEALAYVLSTEDTGCNHHAVDDFLPMVTAVGQGLRRVAQVHPFVQGALHAGHLVGKFHLWGRAPPAAVDAFEVAIFSLNFAGAEKMVLTAFRMADMMSALFEYVT